MREKDTALVQSVLRSGPGIIGTAIEMHRHLVPGLPARDLVNFYKCPKSKKIFFLCFFLIPSNLCRVCETAVSYCFL
jgi:hypothetical protein